jgi:hypothetical protein
MLFDQIFKSNRLLIQLNTPKRNLGTTPTHACSTKCLSMFANDNEMKFQYQTSASTTKEQKFRVVTIFS